MPRQTRKAELAKRQDPAAPFFFDEDQLPLRPDVVESIVQRRYECTGDRLLECDRDALRLVELLVLGTGIKRTAALIGYSPHCVRAARRKLVEQGKIAPYKERVVGKIEEFVEDGLAMMHAAVLDGRMHPNFISSAVGTMWDKRAMALGEPTTISVSATAKLRPEALTVRTLNAFLESLPVEGESSGQPAPPAQIEGEKGFVPTSDDACPARPADPLPGTDLADYPDDAFDKVMNLNVKGGGGGGEGGRGRDFLDGLGEGILGQKIL